MHLEGTFKLQPPELRLLPTGMYGFFMGADMKFIIHSLIFLVLNGVALSANAGTDIMGIVTAVHIDADGNLRFKVNNANSNPYCSTAAWGGLNYFVPKDAPQFAYIYSLTVVSMTKSRNIYMGNISIFNGSTPCDPTKTGYGVMLL